MLAIRRSEYIGEGEVHLKDDKKPGIRMGAFIEYEYSKGINAVPITPLQCRWYGLREYIGKNVEFKFIEIFCPGTIVSIQADFNNCYCNVCGAWNGMKRLGMPCNFVVNNYAELLIGPKIKEEILIYEP